MNINDITDILIDRLNNNIMYWQQKALKASQNEDYITCNEALEKQAREISDLINLVNVKTSKHGQ
jgi:hypothetical protein